MQVFFFMVGVLKTTGSRAHLWAGSSSQQTGPAKEDEGA